MRGLRLSVVCLASLALSGCGLLGWKRDPAAATAPAPQVEKRSWTSRALDLIPFKGSRRDRRTAGLRMEVELTPQPLNLSETRRLQVRVTLTNVSRKMVLLQFPTTQRLEILIRDDRGKVVTQWSEDRAFTNVVSYIAINPRERVEYVELISTRDLVAGRGYFVEISVPQHGSLRTEKTVIPEP